LTCADHTIEQVFADTGVHIIDHVSEQEVEVIPREQLCSGGSERCPAWGFPEAAGQYVINVEYTTSEWHVEHIVMSLFEQRVTLSTAIE